MEVPEPKSSNPYQPPLAEVSAKSQGAWRDGDLVVVASDGVLPNRCVFCNRPSKIQRTHSAPHSRKSAHKSILRVLGEALLSTAVFLIGFAILFVAAYFFDKTGFPDAFPHTSGTLYLLAFIPLLMVTGRIASTWTAQSSVRITVCRFHAVMWRSVGSLAVTLFVVIGLAYSLTDFALQLPSWIDPPGLLIGGVILFGIPGLVAFTFVGFFSPILVRVDERHIWLQGLPKKFVLGLPEFEESKTTVISDYNAGSGPSD